MRFDFYWAQSFLQQSCSHTRPLNVALIIPTLRAVPHISNFWQHIPTVTTHPRAQEKGVEQISETFYPIIFHADTSEDARHVCTMQYIITNHAVYNTKAQIPIYAAIGRSDTHDVSLEMM